MRNVKVALLALAVCLSTSACSPATPVEKAGERPESSGTGSSPQPEESVTIHISVGGKVFPADIETSETGRAFLAKLPLTLEMSELNGNEKYCYGVPLPRADKRFDTLAAGDLMLYSGSCIVLFYGSAGGYSYTRIGRLHSADGLAAALGPGSATVSFAKE